MRHWSVADVTRVAIEVSGEFQFRTDRLHNPERVYFDILNARPQMGSRRVWAETVDDKLLTKIRVAETQPDITRVVLDLSGLVDATTSQLTTPDRLIIELKAGTPVTTATEPPPVPCRNCLPRRFPQSGSRIRRRRRSPRFWRKRRLPAPPR